MGISPTSSGASLPWLCIVVRSCVVRSAAGGSGWSVDDHVISAGLREKGKIEGGREEGERREESGHIWKVLPWCGS